MPVLLSFHYKSSMSSVLLRCFHEISHKDCDDSRLFQIDVVYSGAGGLFKHGSHFHESQSSFLSDLDDGKFMMMMIMMIMIMYATM